MKKHILIKIGLIILLVLAITQVAQADPIDPDFRPINEPFPLTEEIADRGAGGATVIVLQIIAGGLLYFAAPIAIIMIAMGAFNIVSGGADSEKIEQGKKHLTWSIIGLLTIIFSYSIVKFAISFVIKSAEVAS